MARFLCELNQANWLLNHEKLPCILQVIIFSKVERRPYDKCVLSPVLYWELNLLCLCLRSTTPIYWSKDHDLLLVREVLIVDPYSQPKGIRERVKLWEEIALNLSAVSEPRFYEVCKRPCKPGSNKETQKKGCRRKEGQRNSSWWALRVWCSNWRNKWESRGCRERSANDIRGEKSQCREREKASRGYESLFHSYFQ